MELTVKNFGDVVKSWSYDQFMDTFKTLYPADQLEQVAKQLGIEKPKLIKPKKDE